MAKLHLINEDRGTYAFNCPGCGCLHSYDTKPNKPTFLPSLLVDSDMPDRRCHLFMTDGKILFLNDCHHKLAGKTVECPDWEDNQGGSTK